MKKSMEVKLVSLLLTMTVAISLVFTMPVFAAGTSSAGYIEVSNSVETIIPAKDNATGTWGNGGDPNGKSTSGVEWTQGFVVANKKVGEVTYNITVAEDGYFNIHAVTGYPNNGGSKAAFTIYDGETIIVNNKQMEYSSNYYNALQTDLGKVFLSAGDHTIKVVTNSGSFYFYGFKFIPYEMKVSDFITFNEGDTIYSINGCETDAQVYTGVNNTNTEFDLPTTCLSFNKGKKASIKINIPENAMYEITTYIGLQNKDATATITVKEGTENLFDSKVFGVEKSSYYYALRTVAGVGEFTAGEHTLTFEMSNGSVFFFAIGVNQVGGQLKPLVVGHGEKALKDGVIIPKGADLFSAYFNFQLDEASVTSENVTIVDESGNLVDSKIEASEKKILIKLKEALSNDADYTIKLENILPRYGTGLQKPIEYTVTTGGTDSGVSTIECTDKSADYGAVELTFCVKSSVGEAIKGREVTVTRIAPDGVTEVEVFSGVSGINGIVEVTDVITGTDYGNYTYKAECEYAQESKDVVLVYVTKEYEAEILGLLVDITQETIGGFFEDYSSVLGLSLDDIPAWVDETKVYSYFIGATISNAAEMLEKYHLAICTEVINQTESAEVVKNVLNNEEVVRLFELDTTKLGIVLERSETEISENILALDEISDLDDMKKAVANCIEHSFMLICEKADAELDILSTISSYTGKAFEIELKLKEAIVDAVAAEIVISSETMSFDESMTTVEVPEGATYEKVWNGNELTVKISLANKNSISDLGSIYLLPETGTGTYTVDVSGKITYDLNLHKNDNFELEEDIPVVGGIKALAVSVNVAAQQAPSSGDAVSTITPSPSRPVVDRPSVDEKPDDEKPNDDKTDDEDKLDEEKPDDSGSFEFSDIDDVSWAAESINVLLEKGIISESEDKKFNPKNKVTRAEYLKMVMETLGIVDETAENSFSDVSDNDWFCIYAASAQKTGIIMGNDVGEFNPNKAITREDMAVILVRALEKAGVEIPGVSDEKFADDESISEYAKSAIYSLKDMGIINGVGDNQFAPLANATRAESAKVIYELLKVVG